MFYIIKLIIMGMFDKAKDLYKLRKQAKDIKKQLKNVHIEANVKGVVVTVNAEMEVMSILIPDELTNNKLIAEYIKEATNKATKKAQLVAAEKMKSVMGDFGLPGM